MTNDPELPQAYREVYRMPRRSPLLGIIVMALAVWAVVIVAVLVGLAVWPR